MSGIYGLLSVRRLPNKAIHTFWVALTNVVHNCMTKVSINDLRIYDI